MLLLERRKKFNFFIFIFKSFGKKSFDGRGISQENQEVLGVELSKLKKFDKDTLNHSKRVSYYVSRMIPYLNLDEKAIKQIDVIDIMRLSGIFHNIGKAYLDEELVKKTEGFDSKDFENMKLHVWYSHHILKQIDKTIAEIVLRHHKDQARGYPEIIIPTGADTPGYIIYSCAKILNLADFYDSASTRENDRNGEKRILTLGEVKDLIYKEHPNKTKIITTFYEEGIFK